MWEIILCNCGFDVGICFDGQEALERAERVASTSCLTDLAMPRTGGIETELRGFSLDGPSRSDVDQPAGDNRNSVLSSSELSRPPRALHDPGTRLGSLVAMWIFTRRRKELSAFLSSCGYLLSVIVGAAAALYPVLIPSSSDPAGDITITKALAGPHALHVGLAWRSFGIALALLYFITSYRMFRGKVTGEGGYGH